VNKIYVCGPMSGYPGLNEPAFRAAAASLGRVGREVIVPHDVLPREHPGSCPASHRVETQGKHEVACYLRADLAAMLDCDAIYVLDGWEASVGARLEVQVAAACGLAIEFERYREAT
jgi:hypothetical protein